MAYDDYGNWVEDDVDPYADLQTATTQEEAPAGGSPAPSGSPSGSSSDTSSGSTDPTQNVTQIPYEQTLTGDELNELRAQQAAAKAAASGTSSGGSGSGGGPAPPTSNDPAEWERWLREAAAEMERKYNLKPGSLYDPTDLEGVVRNASYERNLGMDPLSFLENQRRIYETRAASGGSRDAGGYDTQWDDDDPRRYSGEYPTSGVTRRMPDGSYDTNGDRSGSGYTVPNTDTRGSGPPLGGPGSPGVYPPPTQQVGQDPFSLAIMQGYSDLLSNQGLTGMGVDINSVIREILANGGSIDQSPQDRAARLEAARQPIDAMRKAQLANVRGTLADRGLLSEPGAPQGSEISAMGRLEEDLAPYYATAGQKLGSEDLDAQNSRLNTALALATGMSSAQAQTFLSTLQNADQRQRMLSEIALASLDRNMTWNRFLAELGLQRAQVMEEMQSGRIEDLTPLLMMFQQYVNRAASGYV